MAQTIIDLLKKGTQANNTDKFRQGNLVCLPAQGRLIITGDIHGHRRNFERILAFADLAKNTDTHIVFQEIIHGGSEDLKGGCLSYKLLFDVIAFKIQFPDRVHIIMGNHDIAFINGRKVMKSGKEMNHSMRSALAREFPQACPEIEQAMRDVLLSQPLAVRCDNRIWLSHSLPNDRNISKFDPQVLERKLEDSDTLRPGSAYLLTWGRKHSQALLDKMAKLFDVDIFVLGHQPQTNGYTQAGDNLIIIGCEHNHGCLMPIDLAKSYTIEQLIDLIVPLASLS